MKWNALGRSLKGLVKRVKTKIEHKFRDKPTEEDDRSQASQPDDNNESRAPAAAIIADPPTTTPSQRPPAALVVGQPAAQSGSRLLALPGELRMLIWHHLFDDDDINNQWALLREIRSSSSTGTDSLGTSSPAKSAPAYSASMTSSAPNRLVFLLASRQVYLDAWRLAWSRVTFHLHSHKDDGKDDNNIYSDPSPIPAWEVMQQDLARRVACLPMQKRRAVTRLSLSTAMLLPRGEETRRRRPWQRFSPRALGMRNFRHLTVWKLVEQPCNPRDGYWFAKQVVRWAVSMGHQRGCQLKVCLVWSYVAAAPTPTPPPDRNSVDQQQQQQQQQQEEEETASLPQQQAETLAWLGWRRGTGPARHKISETNEYGFAHSVRRAMHSVTLYGGLRERVPDSQFKDWDPDTRTITYPLHLKSHRKAVKDVQVQILATRDIIRLGFLPGPGED